MRLILLLLFTTCLKLAAQSSYPIIEEDCYVKLNGGLYENLDYADYLNISYWGLDHRNKRQDVMDYLKNGDHRILIDSMFRSKIEIFKDRFGEEVLCKRLRVPLGSFKYHLRNRYGDNPTFTFGFAFHLYCSDIKGIGGSRKEFSYRYHLDSIGIVEDYSTYLPDDLFETCQYEKVGEPYIIRQAMDLLGYLKTSDITVNIMDSVNFIVYGRSSVFDIGKVFRFNSIDSTFHKDVPEKNKYPSFYEIKKKDKYNELSGKFISKKVVGHREIYQFAIETKFSGPEVDTKIIDILIGQTLHSSSPSKLNAESFIIVRKHPRFIKLTETDSIDNIYFLAGNARETANGYPNMERVLREKNDQNEKGRKRAKFEIFDSSICKDFSEEELNFKFGYSKAIGKTTSTHLWVYTKRKRRSLLGKLEFILSYDTTDVGTNLVSKGKLKVSKEYSFNGLGRKELFDKSMEDTVMIEYTDMAPNKVKVLIRGAEGKSWFDLLPIPSMRLNPNGYGPLLRIDIKVDEICNVNSKIILSIDKDNLSSTSIKYVDYLCDGKQVSHSFGKINVVNEANLSLSSFPEKFTRLSRGEFNLGDTLTVYGEFLNNRRVEILMRCYGSDKGFNFVKILQVPKGNILENNCESVTFIVPHEILVRSSGFPKTMFPISGFIKTERYLDGLAYKIIK